MARARARAAAKAGRRSLRSRLVDLLCALLHRTGLLRLGVAVVRIFGGGGTRVLCYHRVARTGRADDLLPERFAAHLRHLAARFRPLSLPSLIETLDAGAPPRDGVLVTFDDGYADLIDHAIPGLAAAGVPAALFVLTGHFPGPGTLWLDRVAGTSLEADRRELARLPAAERDARISGCEPVRATPPLLSAGAVADLAARDGIEIGSHGRGHTLLPGLDAAAAEAEIAGSRADLEAHAGVAAAAFAYPWGVADDASAGAVAAAGYRAGFVTGGGAIRAGADRYRLPRVHVAGNATVSRLACEAAGLLDFLRGRR